jgi:hypothetical protein
MHLKIYLCCLAFNLLYIVAKENIYDPRDGLTVKDFLEIIFLAITPIGTLFFGVMFIDDLKDLWDKVKDKYVVPPKKIIPKSRLKKVSLDKVVSGLDKTQTSSP